MTAAVTLPAQTADLTTLLRVGERRLVADSVVSLTLSDPSGRELPAWEPGAHIDLILPNSPLARQYSLCGDPNDRFSWRIGVLREPNSRGGSRFVHEQFSVGSTVEVRGPRNHFPLVDAPRYLFIAGGIGITPILPMIAAVDAAGRPWELFYGGRSRRSMAFLEELRGYGGRVRIHPQDEVGRLPLADLLDVPRPDCAVYCCGPEPLLEAVESRCRRWPAGSLHTERFSHSVDLTRPAAVSFEVLFQRSCQVVTVPPDRSILEVAEAVGGGMTLLSACREGVCGTCETRVLGGVPDHRDSVLSETERASGESMMICVSRASSSRLVLDL